MSVEATQMHSKSRKEQLGVVAFAATLEAAGNRRASRKERRRFHHDDVPP